MGSFVIEGGRPLRGEVRIAGAKNAVLPLLSACLLTNEQVTLHGCPDIGDVKSMVGILRHMGAEVRAEGETLCVKAKDLCKMGPPKELA
ncbi:MAG: UDP-N-acetylglucosamine 1-carboxyvinyltransferase, partial [Christensenellaceae bacterium]|nr:UDP-N-acetylglucosamine 1-carboxyvinyltransferase [Christensenellaceae bacterium]